MNIPAIISERLLQFIWQFQYISSKELTTIEGEPLQILHPGFFNTNEGPDFLQAKIKINNTVWAGNIELHIRSSDWYMHGHEKDPNYSNIILHVVWQQDKSVLYPNGHPLPALELQSLVANSMLFQYEQLMQSQGFVPCENLLPVLSDIHWLSWKERLMAERLQRKSIDVLKLLKQANNHWEEVFWWLLARNFGMKVNAGIFEQIARSIPINLLAKHKYQIHQLEALLIGQAGFLNGEFIEDYPRLLQREYHFIQRKYKLNSCSFSPAFLRMFLQIFP